MKLSRIQLSKGLERLLTLEKRIGTGLRKAISDTVKFPSVTVCPRSRADEWLKNSTKISDLDLTTKLDRYVDEINYYLLNGTYVFTRPDFLERNKGVLYAHRVLRDMSLVIKPRGGQSYTWLSGRLWHCFTYDLLEPALPGEKGEMNIKVNGTGVTVIYVLLHNRNQVLLPSFKKMFGATFTEIRLPSEAFKAPSFSYHQTLELARTSWKALDNPQERCDQEGVPDTTGCIARYIENKMGCRVPTLGGSEEKPECTDLKQTETFLRLSHEMQGLNQNSLFNLTGCLSACSKFEYSIPRINDANIELMNDTGIGKGIRLRFLFPESDYQEMEQYLVYDADSFIADVGGFLGLLLGHSILSVAVSAVIWGGQAFDKRRPAKATDKKEGWP